MAGAFDTLCSCHTPMFTYHIHMNMCMCGYTVSCAYANHSWAMQDGDRKGNLRAGTVVDQGVCHPTAYDFYLCSHTGLKGTSKPTHYFVMYDENNFWYVFILCWSFLRAYRARENMRLAICDVGQCLERMLAPSDGSGLFCPACHVLTLYYVCLLQR